MTSSSKNVSTSKNVKIGDRTEVGNYVTIFPDTIIGSDVTIFSGAVLGRYPKANHSINRKPSNNISPLSIGNGTIIGANSVLYRGTTIGNDVLIGDLASVREGCQISDGVVIGRGVLVMYNATIGKNTRIIDGAIITGDIVIEENVFIGPGVNTINDNSPYLRRFGLKPFKIEGPVIRKYALIGAGANINAGVEIGKGAVVAPNSMVTKNVPPWTVVMGIPAIIKRKISITEKKDLLNHFK